MTLPRRRVLLAPLFLSALLLPAVVPAGDGSRLSGPISPLALGVEQAQARPWTATYDWQGAPTTGGENWTVDETVPDTGIPGPWYQTWLGSGAPAAIGRGLGIQPLGGRVYDNGDPSKQTGGPGTILRWLAPGGSRVTQAGFSQLRYRNEGDDQYLRVKVATGAPTSDPLKDFGPAYGQSDPATTYSPPAVTLIPPAPALGVEAWLFTVCGPDPAVPPGSGIYKCPDVPAGTGSFGRVGSTTITLDDPDDPILVVDPQPAIGDGWTNKRRAQKLNATASDPSSGIQRILIQLKLGSSTRTLSNRVVTCDPLHKTAGRNGLVCPVSAASSATDPGRDSSTKDRTYVVTAFDYAGNQTAQTFVVRRDVGRPSSGSVSGELKQLTRGWTNRTGPVQATVRASDSQSGVAKVELLAQRQTGGRSSVIGSADVDCATGCTNISQLITADLSTPALAKDGRYRLSIRVTDRAGNRRTFKSSGPLKLDRTAPRKVGAAPTYDVRKDGSVKVIFTPGRDPQTGVGRLRLFVLRYAPGAGSNGVASAARTRFFTARLAQTAPASSTETRLRRSRSRTVVFRPAGGIPPDSDITLIQLDDTDGITLPPERVGTESGNALEQSVARSEPPAGEVCPPSAACLGGQMFAAYHNIQTEVSRAHLSANEEAFRGRKVAVAKAFWKWKDPEAAKGNYSSKLRFDITLWLERCTDASGSSCSKINKPRIYRGIKASNGPWKERRAVLRKIIAPYACQTGAAVRYYRGAADFDLRDERGKNLPDDLYGDQDWNPNGVKYGDPVPLQC